MVFRKEGNTANPVEANPRGDQTHKRAANCSYQDRFQASHHRILVCHLGMGQHQNAILRSTCGGERGRARTCNRQLRRLMLYPIELLAPRGSHSIVAASRLQQGVNKGRIDTLAIPLKLISYKFAQKNRI